jgi:hypothetical protein
MFKFLLIYDRREELDLYRPIWAEMPRFAVDRRWPPDFLLGLNSQPRLRMAPIKSETVSARLGVGLEQTWTPSDDQGKCNFPYCALIASEPQLHGGVTNGADPLPPAKPGISWEGTPAVRAMRYKLRRPTDAG